MKKEYEIGAQIHMLSRKIKRKLDEAFVSYGITGVQAIMLKFINDKSREGKVYAKDIESEFDMRRATIAGILQLLEQNKLITRKAEGSDARLKEITITKKALEIINNVDSSIAELEKRLEKNMSKEEKENILKTLDKLGTLFRIYQKLILKISV